MKKLASSLPLQDMIRSVINNATEKLAEDHKAQEKVKKLISYEKQEHGHIPSVAEEEAEKCASASTTDPDFIEKLASACDFIAENVDSIEAPAKGVLQQAVEKLAESGSPAGAGKGPGALEVSKSIGGTQKYKKDKPATEDAAASQAKTPTQKHGLPGGATQIANNMDKAPGGGGVKPTGKYPDKGVLANTKSKTASEIAREHILSKLAGEDVLKANISAARTANPLAGMGQLESADASKKLPAQAGGPTGDFGNQGRKHIQSNSAAIGYTKGDAKGPQKTQLKEVLDEPALSKKTDSKLEENLRNTGKAGVKIAAARAVLTKIAQEGCKCEGTGECRYCQLKGAMKGQSEKTANAMMGYGGAGGAGGMSGGAPPPPSMPSMGGMGGGMGAMAAAGASADGCQCGGTGECRVCKLKAALAAANAGAVEKDSMGDVPMSGAQPMGGVY